MKQDDMFTVNVDDLEDCTCRRGTVFGGDYWDAPPTTTPEECEAHCNEVNQRRPTRASRNFALEMERRRLARPPALPPFVAPPSGHVDMSLHNAICARIDEAELTRKYGPAHRRNFADAWDQLRRDEFPDDGLWAAIDVEERP